MYKNEKALLKKFNQSINQVLEMASTAVILHATGSQKQLWSTTRMLDVVWEKLVIPSWVAQEEPFNFFEPQFSYVENGQKPALRRVVRIKWNRMLKPLWTLKYMHCKNLLIIQLDSILSVE